VKTTIIAGRELDSDLASAWVALQRANPDLSSAFFHPEFTRCVASVKPNVEIAIVEDGGSVVAFFPFERIFRSLGEPVGGLLSDYHGLVSAGGFDADFARLDLLRACKLIAWDFSRLPASQSRFHRQTRSLIVSPRIELADGYPAYAERKRACGSNLIDRSAYLARRLGREIGPLRYVAHETDRGILDQVLSWKSAQYGRTGKPDIFRASWTRALVGVVHDTQIEGFGGVLSTLYAGDQLIAGHFGMRSHDSWHYWLPSYNRDFSKYSPGLILILKMAESAAQLGVRMIDLGAGMSQHKSRLATGSAMLSAGSVELSTWRSMRRNVQRNIAAGVRNTPLEAPARAIARSWRALRSPTY
jgi:CelD/BcsL family acetyltransferase involved in cellulose biosynthesis